MKSLCSIFLVVGMLFPMASCTQTAPPAPYGVIPTKHQVDWQQMEYYMFIHFGPNTFNDVEWGDGKEDPRSFNPTAVDCRQWAATAKAAGMKAIIITAKHHDGFCLWPSKYSTHTVRESPWKNGKGDLLKELSDACREYGLKFGVYLSPWDQNHPSYGTPEYNQVFANTLNEVLSGYGTIFEQWFDGANGEGHGGKKQVYDWDLFHQTVYRNQPQAIIFSDIGPGCRWMGNERGVAGETNWSTMNIAGFGPGKDAPPAQILNEGEPDGKAWVPAEVDVSIRPGWFYSPSTNDKVKSLSQLVDIYYTSVGRNSNLLLNVPPDRSGRIHPNDSTRLMEFRRVIEETFAVDLVKDAKITASQTRGQLPEYDAKNMIDGNFDTYWATDDNQLSASIEIDFGQEQTFNRVVLQEYIPLGQRIAAFSVEYWNGAAWQHLDRQTTIGYKRILRFPMITTSKLKINIEKALACPVLNEISVHKAPELNNNAQSSETARKVSDISPAKWTVVSPKGQSLNKAIDGNPSSACALPEQQMSIVIHLGEELLLKGFSYYPVSGAKGNIYRYNFYTSADGKTWHKIKDKASFGNIQNNPVPQFVRFTQPAKARYIKLESVETVTAGESVVIGEIGVITK